MKDPYTYPNTNVLINKLNLQNQSELEKAEEEFTSYRQEQLQKRPIIGQFDFSHLCRIHKMIFQDIYDWAGKPRTINIAKSNLFCLAEYIPTYSQEVFTDLYEKCLTAKQNPAQFREQIVDAFGNINALHPFREGNGRTQREFLRELCIECGYTFDYSRVPEDEMLKASIESFNGSNETLRKCFNEIIQPGTTRSAVARREAPYNPNTRQKTNDYTPKK